MKISIHSDYTPEQLERARKFEQRFANRWFAFHKDLTYCLSLDEAVMISYLINTSDCVKSLEEAKGWFYHSSEQFKESLHLDRHQQYKILSKLIDVGVLLKERRGLPARNYYRIQHDVLEQKIEDGRKRWEARCAESAHLDADEGTEDSQMRSRSASGGAPGAHITRARETLDPEKNGIPSESLSGPADRADGVSSDPSPGEVSKPAKASSPAKAKGAAPETRKKPGQTTEESPARATAKVRTTARTTDEAGATPAQGRNKKEGLGIFPGAAEEPRAQDYAKTLYEALKKAGRVQRRPANWSAAFARLLRELADVADGDEVIARSRIEKVLKWYISNIDGDFVPRAYSAGSFRDKFLPIEAAMQQSEKKKPTRELPPGEYGFNQGMPWKCPRCEMYNGSDSERCETRNCPVVRRKKK